jgi:hypothetical protein
MVDQIADAPNDSIRTSQNSYLWFFVTSQLSTPVRLMSLGVTGVS